MRKGDFPTDGIVKKNLKKKKKSLQKLEQKVQVPHRAKATVCANKYDRVQGASLCTQTVYVLLSKHIYLKYFDIKLCF